MSDMYIVVPSTTPYPNNSPTDFTAQLGTTIYLDKPHELGLTEINFKNGYRKLNAKHDRTFRWVDIMNSDQVIHQPEDVWNNLATMATLEIPNIQYKNIQEILSAINNAIRGYINALDLLITPIQIVFINLENKVMFENQDNHQYLNFNNELSKILGLEKDLWYGHVSPEPGGNVNFAPHISHLHICTNIIEPEIVGNQKMGLLRHVTTAKEEIGTYVNKIFNKPYYKKIQHRSINLIRIWMLDERGEVPSIGNSEVIVVLHLKPI